jgi:hypothetical protein
VSSLALSLCGLAAAGLVVVGILALVTPKRLSRSYGVPVKEAGAIVYVRAVGARDLMLGVILASNVYLKDSVVLIVICAAGLLLSLADFFFALTAAQRLRSEHGAHLGGAIGFAVLLALLLMH